MEPEATSPEQDTATTFEPLPTGEADPYVTPDRNRELLGWGLLQNHPR